MRESCLDCARKHLGQAYVLFDESFMGYDNFFWLAIGHMAEASSELVRDYPEAANEIRDERVAMIDDRSYNPNFLLLIEQINQLEIQEGHGSGEGTAPVE